LSVVIESEVLADGMTVFQVDRQSFGMPTVDGQPPPASPLENWKSVERLKIHDGMESVPGIHRCFLLFNN
jgi:hypothetical protein